MRQKLPKKSNTMKRFKKIHVFAFFSILGLAVYTGVLVVLSEQFLFPYGFKDRPQYPHCSTWLTEEAFADQSQGPKTGPLLNDFGCEQALQTPLTPIDITAKDGMRSRLVLFSDTQKVKAPIFLQIHGVTGDFIHASRYLSFAKKNNLTLAALEYRNHGLAQRDNLGVGWGCKENQDLVAAVEWLLTNKPGREIIISATSMGTMVTSLSMEQIQALPNSHRVKGVILESPISNVIDLVTHSKEAPPLPLFLLNSGLWVAELRSGVSFRTIQCSPQDALQKIKRPVLVHSSKQDMLTPTPLTKAVVQAIPKEYLYRWTDYPRGYHSTVWNGQVYLWEQEVLKFLNDTLTAFDLEQK